MKLKLFQRKPKDSNNTVPASCVSTKTVSIAVQPKKSGSHHTVPASRVAADAGVVPDQEGTILSLPRDLQLLIARNPVLGDADWRSMQLSCRALRGIYQDENLWRERARNLPYLPECVFDHPDFSRFNFNYRQLVGILVAGGEGLSFRLRYGAEPWQLAALLGLEDQLRIVYQCPLRNVDVSQRMKDTLLDFEDENASGIRDHFIIGNQQEKLVSWMKYYRPNFKASDDPLLRLPILAVSVGGIPMLQCLVKHYGYDIKAFHPEDGSSLLYFAVFYGQRKMAKWLIEQGLSITKGVKRGQGDSFLCIAAEEGYWDIYRDLEARGAVPTHDSQYDDLLAQGAVTLDLLPNDSYNDYYQSIMFSAIRRGNKAVYETMAEKCQIKPAKSVGPTKKIYFEFAIASGNHEMITCALDKKTGWGAIKDTFDNGETVLHIVARKGHVALIARLLREYPRKLDPRVTSQTGNTILHSSVGFGSYRITKQLYLDYFAPMELKSARNKREVIALLRPNNRGETIVHIGASCNHVNFLHLLRKEHGDEPFKVLDKANNSALHRACFNGAYKVTFWLIKIVGLSLTAVNKEGDTPLHVLVKCALDSKVEWGKVEMITAQVDYSLLTDYKNKAGDTVRDLMARDNDNDLVLQDLEERAVALKKSGPFPK
jgi:ankyrin repeat protein